jgi:Tfp pilus assembly protein PilZ
MVQHYEKRADARKIHKSPITIEDQKFGNCYRGRMVNYCKNGLYFETDWLLESGKEILIEIENLPGTSSFSDHKDSYRAEIRWHTELEDSLCKHGYGAVYIAGSDIENVQRNRLKETKNSREELRKHPRRSYQKTVFFISENQAYQGLANNISNGGIFIETKDKFSVGQIIQLVIPGTKIDKGVMLNGEVIYIKPKGVGVKFKALLNKGRPVWKSK